MAKERFEGPAGRGRGHGPFAYWDAEFGPSTKRAASGRARRGRKRRIVKGSVFGPFGPLGAFGPMSPFGPFGPLRRRGLWKYIAAAGIAQAAARAAVRRFDGREPERRSWAARAWARSRGAWRQEDDRAQRSYGPRGHGARRGWTAESIARSREEGAMPRFGRGGFPGFDKPNDHGHGNGHGNGRRFDRGDVKYVLLDLLREGPRHGYDMIKELEKRSGGLYSPSPGSVYPTLQMLEDQGLVASTTVDGKRTYRLTDAGYTFIEERPERTDDARGRAWGEEEGREGFRDEARSVGREAGELARSLRDAVRSYTPDSRQITEIRDVLGDTRKRIEAILAERREAARDDESSNKPTTV